MTDLGFGIVDAENPRRTEETLSSGFGSSWLIWVGSIVSLTVIRRSHEVGQFDTMMRGRVFPGFLYAPSACYR